MKLPNLYPSDEPHRYDERFGKASILMAARVLLDRLLRAGMFLHIGRNKHGSNRPDVINVIF